MSAAGVLERSLETLAGLTTDIESDVDGDVPVTWGQRAAEFQWEFAEQVLDPAAETQQFWDERPRGANKTTDVAALAIVLLLEQAPHRAKLYVGSLDEDAAAELIEKAATVIELSGLSGLFEVTGLTVRCRRNGAKLVALPMDASAMGKDAWVIIIDEVTNFPDTRRAQRFWTVLTSGNRKRRGCRTIVIANAPEAEHWSYRQRETASKSRHWRFASVPGPLPWLGESDLAALRENVIWPSDFDRLHLNQVTSGEDALAPRADVEACCQLEKPQPPMQGRLYAIGLDMATRRDNAVATVMHAEPAGSYFDVATGRILRSDRPRLFVDQLKVWTPNPGRGHEVDHAEVEAWVVEQSMRYSALVNYDPAQLLGMAQRFRRIGIAAVEFTFSTASVGRLGALLSNLLRQREIVLPIDEALVEELVHVRLRRTGPGAYRLDHDSDRHDDRATALALGAAALLDPPVRRNVAVAGERWAWIQPGRR